MDRVGGASRFLVDMFPHARYGGALGSAVRSVSLGVSGGGFAWQAWGIAAIGRGANVDARGRCVHGACVSRGRRGEWWHWRLAGHRFAWQAQGTANCWISSPCATNRLCVCTSTCLPGRNCGRRRACADLWMYTRGGRFAIRNGSLTKRTRSMAVCACRNAVGSCEQ